MHNEVETALKEIIELGKKFTKVTTFSEIPYEKVVRLAEEESLAAIILGDNDYLGAPMTMTPLEWLQIDAEHDTECYSPNSELESQAFSYVLDTEIARRYPQLRAECEKTMEGYLQRFIKLKRKNTVPEWEKL